jgi:hypothetical protein
MKITTNIELTYEMLENVIVTALEGGSNYWYLIKDTDIPPRELDDYTPASIRIARMIWDGGILPVYDAEEPEVHLGDFSLRQFAEHAPDAPWAFTELLNDNLDATSADALFQLGTMGEVIFG